MSKVAVLGGAGFIGSYIVRELLTRGHQVRTLVRTTTDVSLLEGLPIEQIIGDMENVADLHNLLRNCDALIHAAAWYPTYSLGKQKQVERGVDQIRLIHTVLAATGVQRFVYVSSLSAVGQYPDDRPEDEHAPYPNFRLRSTYNSVKRAMQEWVLAEADQFRSVVVAPTGVFGPGDRKPTSGRVLVDLAKGKLPVGLKAKLNVVDVRTVAMGTVSALEHGKMGRLYVLGGENTTLEAFLKQAAKVFGVRPPSLYLNPAPLRPVAVLSEWVSKLFRLPKPQLPIVGVEFALYGTHLSSAQAVNEIGYVPGHLTTDQMLVDSFRWFREKGYI
ncbi:NAD-dependent epimerase/dehydratase family protein [bacterium]|nr:NAD-dependent epimerase/dehydratase family protein [bacterium]